MNAGILAVVAPVAIGMAACVQSILATSPAPQPAGRQLGRVCETTGCGYRASRVVVDADGTSDRCEGCATEGQARGWWDLLSDRSVMLVAPPNN